MLLGTPDPAQPDFSVGEAGLGFIWNPDFRPDNQLQDGVAGRGRDRSSSPSASAWAPSSAIRLVPDRETTTSHSPDLPLHRPTSSPKSFSAARWPFPQRWRSSDSSVTQELATNTFDMAFAVMPALFQQLPGRTAVRHDVVRPAVHRRHHVVAGHGSAADGIPSGRAQDDPPEGGRSPSGITVFASSCSR